MRDQVSHPYKTTGRIMFFLCFSLYVPRQEAGRKKDSGPNGSKYFPL
jgi:hypothetical protein